MKKDNQLVAYIQAEGGVPFIDIIRVSKKGSSYFYDDVWWMREAVLRSGYCTSAKGDKLKISPLNRHYDPYEDYPGEIEIKPLAKERYELWLSGAFSLSSDPGLGTEG